ncbi:MAG TPA: hopanoid-associated sugar epimerase [Rhizomicrobium sp.]|nr:hopanoid-associated sugar epimerase [Rhizomicrobium sp.]
MSDTVLVTGASGFVGSSVARALIARGFRVRVLMRPASPKTNVAELDAEIVPGDMRDETSMRAAMKGARYFFHVAADYRLWARDMEEIVRNNRDGTHIVMEAALSEGVEKVVYTSSVATLKPIAGQSVDETSRHDEKSAIGAYKRSKVVAEQVVEQLIAARGLPATIVSPSTPIGPRDVKPTPTGRILVEAASGKMPAYVDTGLNLVHVDDVAEGHLLALDKGQIGERYILGGQDATLAQMLAVIARMSNRRPPRVSLPQAPLYPLAYAAEAFARLSGSEPFLTVDALRMSEHHMFFSSAKAERELGFRARPYDEAIADALAWFRGAGYIR